MHIYLFYGGGKIQCAQILYRVPMDNLIYYLYIRVHNTYIFTGAIYYIIFYNMLKRIVIRVFMIQQIVYNIF